MYNNNRYNVCIIVSEETWPQINWDKGEQRSEEVYIKVYKTRWVFFNFWMSDLLVTKIRLDIRNSISLFHCRILVESSNA